MTSWWLDKLVDIVIAPACFHLDGMGFEGAAVIVPVSANFPCDNSVTFAWVATC